MTKTVDLVAIKPDQAMSIVKQLREQGYVQGQDFDFAFHQSDWDSMIGEIPSHTVFTFYTDALATLFALRYQK
jgi:hypothetical protein